MTPDQARKLDESYAFMQSFMQSSTVSRTVETSLAQRLGSLKATGTGTAGATTPISSFPFSLPANPSGTLHVQFNGIDYELLVK